MCDLWCLSLSQENKTKLFLHFELYFKVSRALSEEIRRLSVLVDEFSDPFHPDPLVVNVYKSKLNHYVESGMSAYEGRYSNVVIIL